MGYSKPTCLRFSWIEPSRQWRVLLPAELTVLNKHQENTEVFVFIQLSRVPSTLGLGLAGQMSDDLRVALRMERDLDSELNGIVKSPESADQLVRKLIDQEFWGGDARSGFGPFEGTGGVSAFSEVLKQSGRTRNVLSKYVDSDAPTRLVYHYPNKLPRMRGVTLGAVAQGLLDRIDTESGANK